MNSDVDWTRQRFSLFLSRSLSPLLSSPFEVKPFVCALFLVSALVTQATLWKEHSSFQGRTWRWSISLTWENDQQKVRSGISIINNSNTMLALTCRKPQKKEETNLSRTEESRTENRDQQKGRREFKVAYWRRATAKYLSLSLPLSNSHSHRLLLSVSEEGLLEELDLLCNRLLFRANLTTSGNRSF